MRVVVNAVARWVMALMQFECCCCSVQMWKLKSDARFSEGLMWWGWAMRDCCWMRSFDLQMMLLIELLFGEDDFASTLSCVAWGSVVEDLLQYDATMMMKDLRLVCFADCYKLLMRLRSTDWRWWNLLLNFATMMMMEFVTSVAVMMQIVVLFGLIKG